MSLPRQIIKFSLVGVMAAVIDLGGYLLLTRIFDTHYVLTSILTSTAAVSFAFFNNRHWTFRAKPLTEDGGATWGPQYVRYLTVYGFGIVWQNLLLLTLVEYGQLYDWLAKVVAILIVAFGWNFILAKLWVFRYTRSTFT
jgi:putative flippase GtrA